ncbi:hypothetical protein PMAYCL1PPCAC_20385, partial [Pristionchus mayeri]
LIFDYSQKWESTQFREAQPEYYAKGSGLSWHEVTVYANISGKIVIHSMTHLMGDEDQDATAVVGIAHHTLAQLEIMGINLLPLFFS